MPKKLLLLLTCTLLAAPRLFAQGTGFTYQGRLNVANSPANGFYDLQFSLWNASTLGAQTGATVTRSGITVSNGLFTAVVDFGAVWNGTAFWLQIAARSNGVASYVTLSPRQQITPSPYAITSQNLTGTLNASQLTGTLPGGLLSGAYANSLTLNNAANTVSGNGSGLTALNASQLATGTILDARLSPNVALLNRSQTFTATDVFSSGGGAGRLIVSNAFTAVDTNRFTGLSFQYDGTYGEGALMSSYDNGTAYLSFYTKPNGAFPLTKQMAIGAYGDVALDLGNNNDGVLNHGSLSGAGLSFGSGSGEGIASKRTPGGDQYGLDFYTAYANRLSILNSGFVGIGRQTPVTGADVLAVRSPAGPGSYGGMYIDTAGTNALPFYGYAMNGSAYAWTFLDGGDANKWKLYNGGSWLTVTRSGQVGIGTTAPTETLDIHGTSRINDHDLYLRGGTDRNHGLGYRSTVYGIGTDGPFLYGWQGGALGTSDPDEASLVWDWHGNVWISNNCSVATLTIRGGADLAEPFPVSDGETEPGTVMVIDENHPGHLLRSLQAYDTRVAGVISGAGGVQPGLELHQAGVLDQGQKVALSGRVYVKADATDAPIKPGDLLTTSEAPGCAMKATDHARTQGAVLGKAMTGLKAGRGLVLVLVTLQ